MVTTLPKDVPLIAPIRRCNKPWGNVRDGQHACALNKDHHGACLCCCGTPDVSRMTAPGIVKRKHRKRADGDASLPTQACERSPELVEHVSSYHPSSDSVAPAG